MEKKGFTLAELMGVIVILAVLAIIIVPVVDKNLKKGRNVTCKTQEKSILEAAKNYYNDNITLLTECENKGGVCKITVRELVKNGYLEGSSTTTDDPPINPGTDEPYENETYVQISNITGYNFSYTLIYEGNDRDSCEGE